MLWQKCQKFSNFKIRVCAVHSIGIRNVKLGFAAMLTNTICSGVYGNQVKNRKILWRNQHILRDLINLFVENVNCKVIFSTMKLDMRAKKWSPPVVIKGCLAKISKFEMFIKDFCKSTNVSIWQIFFRKIYSRLREYKNNICVSEITEKRSQQNSRFSTFEKLAFRSSNSPIWDWWMWNDCDKCCQTWLWLQKMLPWIPLSISAKNPHGSPQGNPHLLLKVKDWYLEKSIRNLSNFTDSSTYFTPLSRPPRRNSLRSSSKIYSVSFQVSYFGSDLNFDSSDF